jgi:hypothetical protein
MGHFEQGIETAFRILASDLCFCVPRCAGRGAKMTAVSRHNSRGQDFFRFTTEVGNVTGYPPVPFPAFVFELENLDLLL